MTIRISKAKRETLANMILAHRVAVRKAAKARSEQAEDLLDCYARENITQFSLDIALGDTDPRLAEYLNDCLSNSEYGFDAYVAKIRLAGLGIII